MIYISRKKMRKLLADFNVAEQIKSGPVCIFFTDDKPSKNGKPKKAKSVRIKCGKKLLITRFGLFFHIYRLDKLKSLDISVNNGI